MRHTMQSSLTCLVAKSSGERDEIEKRHRPRDGPARLSTYVCIVLYVLSATRAVSALLLFGVATHMHVYCIWYNKIIISTPQTARHREHIHKKYV